MKTILRCLNGYGRRELATWLDQLWDVEWWKKSKNVNYLAWFAFHAGVDENLVRSAESDCSGSVRSPYGFFYYVPWGVVEKALNNCGELHITKLTNLIEEARVESNKRLEERGKVVYEIEDYKRTDYFGDKYYTKLLPGEEELHRDNDLPARIDTNGDQYWYRYGAQHRENDKPAVVRTNGDLEWYLHNMRHRANDKPAIVQADGGREWWINDFLCHKMDASGRDVLKAEASARFKSFWARPAHQGRPMIASTSSEGGLRYQTDEEIVKHRGRSISWYGYTR